MNIADSYLKAQLQNVLWVGGAAFGGKTTITDLVAAKHGFKAYHSEDLFDEHKRAASPEDHPALHAPFLGWERFFNRPLEEYIKGIEDSGREQFGMVVLDLVRMSADTRVVADAFFLDPQWAGRLTGNHRSVFLYADEQTIRSGFFARADKEDLCQVLDTLADPAGTREHCLDVTCACSARRRHAAEAAGVRMLVRDGQTDLQETLAAVEAHFRLA
jgi:2-phosphoglycerate kinase